MAHIAMPAFLNGLRSIYPRSANGHNPWYIVASVAFSASNVPEAVPIVFQHAVSPSSRATSSASNIATDGTPSSDATEDALQVARKMRDALFKSGLTSGYPRAINSLAALHDAMPQHLRDTQPSRDLTVSIADYEKRGAEYFRTVYGDTATSVQGLLDSIYPDMGWFSNTIGYGLTYSHTSVLTPLETCYTLVAALVAGDTPRQITWHLEGARRVGATTEQVRAIRQMSVDVARACGVVWRNEIPQVD